MAADAVRICMQPDDLSLETCLELDGVLEKCEDSARISGVWELLAH